MAEILIGTSGYNYTEWLGSVYPIDTPKLAFLSVYAGMFSTVELNCYAYTMPTPEGLACLLDQGGDLCFSIKAHRSLTHTIAPAHWEHDAKTYLTALAPLQKAGRLEAVLFQFPASFRYTVENRRYLDKLLCFFKDAGAAVEFRTADWYTGKLIDGLRRRSISLVSLDMPDLHGIPPLMDVVTAPTAYIRLHGRNKTAWWGSDGYERYNYVYSASEIEAWAVRLDRMSGQAKRILVYFNNHPLGNAARNAQALGKIVNQNRNGAWNGQ